MKIIVIAFLLFVNNFFVFQKLFSILAYIYILILELLTLFEIKNILVYFKLLLILIFLHIFF